MGMKGGSEISAMCNRGEKSWLSQDGAHDSPSRHHTRVHAQQQEPSRNETENRESTSGGEDIAAGGHGHLRLGGK